MAGVAPNIYAVIAITLTAAVVAVVLRLLARRMTKFHLWFDDYFCLLAFLCAISYSTSVIIRTDRPLPIALVYGTYYQLTLLLVATVYFKLGQSTSSLDDEETQYVLEKARLLLWVNELSYASSLAFSKLAIVTLYWRIFQHTSIRIPILILIGTCTVWLIIRTFMVLFQCHPIHYIWNKSIHGTCVLNMSEFFFWTILIHCTMDVIILVLPIIPVVQMHLSWQQKLAIVGLFTSGIIVVAASIVVLVDSIRYNPDVTDFTVEISSFTIWGAVEVNLAIFCSCMPTLRPVFRRILPSGALSTEDSGRHSDAIRLSQVRLPRDIETGKSRSSRSRMRESLGRIRSGLT